MKKRYLAIVCQRRDAQLISSLIMNLYSLIGADALLNTHIKLISTERWGIIIRLLSTSGAVHKKMHLAIALTQDTEGWMQTVASSGTLRGLRAKLIAYGFELNTGMR